MNFITQHFNFAKQKTRKWIAYKPQFGDMDISLEFVLDRFGLHNPLVGSLPIFMNKLSGLVGVHGMNLILSVLNVRGLNLKALNEHFYRKKN